MLKTFHDTQHIYVSLN